MRTFSLKAKDVSRKWYILDASEVPLGRLATKAASLLLGKGKVSQTPHVDDGDYVVVINATSLVASGEKTTKKIYYRHSGYPSGLYRRSLREQLDQDPKKVIEHAVRGMLPDNKLRKGRLGRLKVYEGREHGHAGQNPVEISIEKGSR